jgi:hypothetical protein
MAKATNGGASLGASASASRAGIPEKKAAFQRPSFQPGANRFRLKTSEKVRLISKIFVEAATYAPLSSQTARRQLGIVGR